MAKVLVAYFSRAGENYTKGGLAELKVGNTQVVAEKLASMTDADLFKIERVVPYPDDYQACVEEAKKERQGSARPAIKEGVEDLSPYGTILLGYPNYCGTMPMPVWTFLLSHNLCDRRVAPFCTHGGSGLGRSVSDIVKLCPGDCEIMEGIAIRGEDVGDSDAALKAWVTKLGLV